MRRDAALLLAMLALSTACKAVEDTGTVVCQGNCDCRPPESICVGGRCAPGCTKTGCESGYECNRATGFCQTAIPDSCRMDADCFPPDGICESGLCEPGCTVACCTGGTVCDTRNGRCVQNLFGVCTSDRECGPPRGLCVGGRCQAATPCQGDHHCDAPDTVCVGGFCRDGCVLSGCAADEVCDPVGGHCEAGPPQPVCASDAACTPPSTVCDAGACVPGCATTGCGAGTHCDASSGRCATDPPPPECAADADCAPPETVCEAGDCIPGCGATGCPAELVCRSATGRCGTPTPLTCASDAACGAPALVCEAGTCVAGCGTAGCPAGSACASATGRCTALPPPCQTDAACGPPARICLNTQCIDGCLTTGCSAAERCESATGRCVAVDPPCQTDAACSPPTTVCEGGRCVPGCTTPGEEYDCAATERCNFETGRCELRPEDLPLGADCGASSECRSGWCGEATTIYGETSRFCTSLCCSGAECPSGMGCLENRGVSYCVPARAVPGATFTRSAFGSCEDANECRDAVCEMRDNECVPTCCRHEDCPGMGAYRCTLWGTQRICDSVLLAGSAGVGENCCAYGCEMGVYDCFSGICTDSSLGPICTDLCCTSADCPAGFRCVQTGSDDGSGGYFFANACQPKEGGTKPLGEVCDPNAIPSECDSMICVDGRCAAPCCHDTDCGTGQDCVPAHNLHPDGNILANLAVCQ